MRRAAGARSEVRRPRAVTTMARGPLPEGPRRSRISSKGQVVIPHALRQWADLRPGDDIVFTAAADGSIRVERADEPASPFAQFRGAWRGTGVTIEGLRAMRHPEMGLPGEDERH